MQTKHVKDSICPKVSVVEHVSKCPLLDFVLFVVIHCLYVAVFLFVCLFVSFRECKDIVIRCLCPLLHL